MSDAKFDRCNHNTIKLTGQTEEFVVWQQTEKEQVSCFKSFVLLKIFSLTLFSKQLLNVDFSNFSLFPNKNIFKHLKILQ